MTTDSEKQIAFDQVIQQLQAGASIPAELMEIFTEEADDHLRSIYEGLHRIKENQSDHEALSDVRRSAHTFKGAAGAVNMQAAAKLAHRMEDLLDRLAARKEVVTDQQLKLLLATADQLQELASAEFESNDAAERIVELYHGFTLEMGDHDTQFTHQAFATDWNVASSGQAIGNAQAIAHADTGNSSQPTQYLRVPLDRLDQLVSLVGEMMVNRSECQHRLSEFGSRIEDMQSAMQRLGNVMQYVDTHDRANRNPLPRSVEKCHSLASQGLNSTPDFNSSHGFDALEFESSTEFDRLGQTLSEAENDAEILSGEFWKIKSSFESLVRRQEKLHRDAQKSLMRIRMVPLSGIVSRLERTVRTVAEKLGRDVELEIEGERIELDKTVMDVITDPMLHLIRNAIDHGIEDPDTRVALGKPASSKLRITAINRGTQVEIRISDDGAGIDLDKVRKKATEQGLIEEDQELSDDELRSMIFRAGFSTAQSLTDVSGRGVGMDVVSDAIRRLKGSIHVESQTGSGTTFMVRLPTTLGVMRAVFVEAGGGTFAIPMQSIRQIQLLDPEAVSATDAGWTTKCIDRNLRLVDLAVQLGWASHDQTSFEKPGPLLMVNSGFEDVALTVDAILGSHDIVVKSIGDHLKKVRGIIGATINGDGSVVPILDMTELVEQDQADFSAKFEHDHHASGYRRRRLAMVVDDSISIRRVTESLLASAGWDVVTAQDGVDALEKLTVLESPPDLFLSDMEMPRMDGLELVRQIREQREFESTPIIMVTSRASEKHRHKAFEAGATEYVVKPYNDVKLMELINHLVQMAEETAHV